MYLANDGQSANRLGIPGLRDVQKAARRTVQVPVSTTSRLLAPTEASTSLLGTASKPRAKTMVASGRRAGRLREDRRMPGMASHCAAGHGAMERDEKLASWQPPPNRLPSETKLVELEQQLRTITAQV
jgi:hypothetical protein